MRRILTSLIGLILLLGLPVLAYFIFSAADATVQTVAIMVGLVLGIIGYALIARYAGYLLTCGQIAMIEHGISQGEMPKNVYKSGIAVVKAYLAPASVYFVLKSLTSSITSQITKGINTLTDALGGSNNETAKTIGGFISLVISIVLEYINYCCLGWVFHHKEQSVFKSTCDGAVLYFQNWKALLKNVGKVLIITLLSFVLVAIPLIIGFGVAFEFSALISQVFAVIDTEFALEVGTSMMICAMVCAIILWSSLHGALVKPFILVSVMRTFIEAGDANPPKADLYGKLCGISSAFKKALGKFRPGEAGGTEAV